MPHPPPSNRRTPTFEAIIAAFNERWFSAWSATPEEQRVKLVNIVERVRNHARYAEVVKADLQNREIALADLINQAVLAQRKTDMELYQLRLDEAFKQAFNEAVLRILVVQEAKKAA